MENFVISKRSSGRLIGSVILSLSLLFLISILFVSADFNIESALTQSYNVLNVSVFFNNTQATTSGINLSGGNLSGDFRSFVYWNSIAQNWNVTLGLSNNATNRNATIQFRTASAYNMSDPSLMAFWSFNRDNSTTAIDEIGRYNGTRQGSIADAVESSGIVGKGYLFDGVNDYLNLGSSAIITTPIFSISSWFKTNITSGYIFNQWTGGGGNGTVSVSIGNSKIYVYFQNSTAPYGQVVVMQPSVNSNDNLWHLVTVTSNGTNVSLYFDGTLRASSSNDGTLNIVPYTYIGFSVAGGASYFNGSIDDVKIYNRSLGASEILDLYNLGTTQINDWSAYDSEQPLTSGVPVASSASNKFMQFRVNLYTNQSGNSPKIIYQSSSTSFSECGDLIAPNTVYTLINNVTSTGTCFNVYANNITLDCNGYMINYSSSAAVGYAFNSTGYNGTTIKNCIIKEGVAAGNYRYPIYLTNLVNASVLNSNITTFSAYAGIYFLSANASTIVNNRIITSGAYPLAVWLDSSSNSNISYNIINTSGSYDSWGIRMDRCMNNTLKNNSVNTTKDNAYQVWGGSLQNYNHSIDGGNLAEGKPVNYTFNADNLVWNNTDFTVYGEVIVAYSRNMTIINSNFSWDSLNLYWTNTSTIAGNRINTTTGMGIYALQNSILNTISNNTIITSASDGYGIYLMTAGSNNLFNNTISTSNTYGSGIYISQGSNNNVSGNTVTTLNTYGSGLQLSGSNYNNISNNVFNIRGAGAFGIYPSSSSHSIFVNNTIRVSVNTNSYGIYLASNSNNNSFSNMDIKTNTTNGYGIYLGDTTRQNFTFVDSVINSTLPNIQAFLIPANVLAGEWNFTNVTTENGSSIAINWSANANGTLNMMWYANNYINYTNRSNASGIVVTAYNTYVSQTNNSLGLNDSSLISYWNFNNDNSTTAFDAKGRNNANYSSSSSGNISGVLGNASGFNGLNGYFNFSTINLDINWTISLWVYIVGTSTNANSIFTNFSTSSNNSFWIRTSDGYTRFTNSSGTSVNWAAGSGQYGAFFKHVTLVANATNVGLYLNGILISTQAITPSLAVNTFGFGLTGLNYFNGSMDEVRIYNRTLTLVEVQTLYLEGLARNFTNTTNSAGNARLALLEYSMISTNGTPATVYYSNYTINATTNYYPETSSQNMSTNRNPTFTIDNSIPAIVLTNPGNNTFAGNGTINFTANLSDVGDGVANATLWIYFTNGTLFNSTIVTFTTGTLTSTIGVVVTLIDGIYTWFWQIFDLANNPAVIVNSSLTIDTVYPGFNFAAPLNNSYFNSTSVFFNVSVTASPNGSIVPNIDSSLVSWVRFENGNGTFFADQNGLNNMTCSGTTCPVYDSAGRIGGSYSFDGSNDFATSPSIITTQNISIFGWVKPANVAGPEQHFFAVPSGNSNQDPQLYKSSGSSGLNFVVFDGNYLCIGSGIGMGNLANRVWTQIGYTRVANYSGSYSNYTLYKNGAIVSSRLCNGTLATGQIQLARKYVSSYYFNGSMDDVVIYNKSISPDEVLSIYNATTYSHTETFSVQGNHTFSAYTQDSAGNVNQTGLVTFGVDTIYPNVTFTTDTMGNGSFSSNLTVGINTSDANSVSSFVDLDSGLVSWWRIDDLNSSGGVIDYLGRNNGTNNGATQVTNGKFGKAMSFDGVDDRIDISYSQSLNITRQITITGWAYLVPSVSAYRMVLGRDNMGSERVFDIGIGSDGKTRFYLWNSSGSVTQIGGSATINTNAWYHYALTYNGSLMTAYINGIQNGTPVAFGGNLKDSNQALRIGTDAPASDLWNGSIDDVMIFNRSLSAPEIQALYANTTSRYTSFNYTGLAEGTHTYKVYSQDTAGNVNSTDMRTVMVDTIIPNSSFGVLTENNGTYFNRTYITVDVNVSDTANVSTFVNLDSGLVSWLRMDDMSGTTAIDYMGRNNATVSGAVQATDGKFGKAMSFDGVDDSMQINPLNGLNVSNKSLNIGFWVKLPTSATAQGFLTFPATNGYRMVYSAANLFTVRADNSSGTIFSLTYSQNITDNTWHYLNWDINNLNSSFYIDGVIKNSTLIVGDLENINFFKVSSVVGSFLNGSIDDVMIFNRSLSAEEISALYANTTSKYSVLNFTGLGEGVHTFKVYTQDSAGNINATELRTQTLDRTAPSGVVINYSDNTHTSEINTRNFTLNVSDTNIANATFKIFNSTGLFNFTFIGPITNTVGVINVVIDGFVDGVYIWFWEILDKAGNLFTTTNRTITIDTTYPLIEFNDLINPLNETGTAEAFNLSIIINETNIANVSLYFDSTLFVYDFDSNNSYFTNGSANNSYIFSVQKGPLGATDQIYYNLTVTDRAGNSNYTLTRLITGNTPPSLVSISHSPLVNDSLDPGILVEINATLSDTQNNFDSAWLQWKNSSQSWEDIIGTSQMIKMETNGSTDLIFVNATFILPNYESNIYYRIFANDSVGGQANLTEYLLPSFWDCTWQVTSDLGATAGWNQNKNIGTIWINNTGDPAYGVSNCSLDFRITYNLDEGRIYYDGEYVKNLAIQQNSVTAKNNVSIAINATFGTTTKQESLSLTVDEFRMRSLTRYQNTSATIITNRAGPYLYQAITSSPAASLYLTQTNLSFNSYIRNLMGSTDVNDNNTAFNVSFYWDIPSEFINSSGDLNITLVNISDNIRHYNNVNLIFTDSLASMSPGVRSFNLKSYGYNSSGDIIVDANNNSFLVTQMNITFQCYNVSDGLYVTACGILDGDYVAPSTSSEGSSGGGGGGGGAGGTYQKSEATFEIVHGKSQSFTFDIKNKYPYNMNKVKISVSGLNSQYLSIEPSSLENIPANSFRSINVSIDAPSYFEANNYTLKFVIQSELDFNGTKQSLTEEKFVTLYILDISREEARGMVDESKNMVEEMNKSNMTLTDVLNLFDALNKSYLKIDFNSVKNNYDAIKLIYVNAFDSKKSIEELTAKILEAEQNGISVDQTKKLLFIAEVAYNRGDYALTIQRLKEARLTFGLETKGEFNLIYSIKNNPLQAFGYLIFAGVVGMAGSVAFRFQIYRKRLSILKKEEVLLLELMKLVQRECFENNKMSMNEYQEAMNQYERRLTQAIAEKIETETKLANLLKIKGNKTALDQERTRLIEMIKKAQDDYLNKGTLETRIYENTLKSYTSRLSEVDESLAFLEAKEALKGENKIMRLFKK